MKLLPIDPFFQDLAATRSNLSIGHQASAWARARVLSPLLVALAIVLTFITPAEAQRRGRGPFGFRGMDDGLASLVFVGEVQAEIEISDEQQEFLTSLQEDLANQFRGRFRRGFRGGFGGSRNGGERGGLRLDFETIPQQGDDLVVSILEPEQTKRLQELRLQRQGVRAFDRAEIVRQLELTDDQIDRIRAIREADNRNGERENGDETRRDQDSGPLDGQILAVLTDQQKTAWNAMRGKEFQFPRIESRRNVRGRRPGDGPFRRRPEE